MTYKLIQTSNIEYSIIKNNLQTIMKRLISLHLHVVAALCYCSLSGQMTIMRSTSIYYLHCSIW